MVKSTAPETVEAPKAKAKTKATDKAPLGLSQTLRENPWVYVAGLVVLLLICVVFACVAIYALTVIFDPAGATG